MLNVIAKQDLRLAPELAFPTVPSGLTKRLFDLVVATLALIMVLPLLLILMAAIVLESPGSPLFVQERLGLHGRRFRLLKLRTMVADAEQRRAEVEHLNELKGPLFKAHNDPRITRMGRFLRTTSLDELPQLINIIRGQMSIVGPRPRLPEEMVTSDPAVIRRLSVKPGLAGLWQVNGRATLDYDQALALDLKYVETHSFWLDLKLILQTAWVVLTMHGAC